VIFVSPRFAKLMRKAKGTGGGSYLFPPGLPMFIDTIPIVELDGLPTAGPHAIVGDFSQIIMIQRLLPNGLLAKVDRAYLGLGQFNVDKEAFRVVERFDIGLVPGAGSSIRVITGITAP
jgi:HK97 family phage major capsid protein